MLKIQRKEKASLVLLLAGAFLLRLVLLAVTKKYPYDAQCFYGWALGIAKNVPIHFYENIGFADYPPGAILTLLPAGLILRLCSIGADQRAAAVVLGFLPAEADIAIAWMIWAMARSRMKAPLAFRMAAIAAFAPGLWYSTAIWGQVDSLFLTAMLGCLWLMELGNYPAAALVYGVGLALKPQALLLGPVIAICFLLHYKKQLLQILQGAVLALLPPILCGLPFYGLRVLPGLWEKYFTTAESYPYATVNGFNWIAALGGNWRGQSETLLFLTWQQWGTVAILLLTVGLVYLAVHGERLGRLSPMLLGALYTVGIFTFSHRMHERYLLLGMVLTLAAAALRKEHQLTTIAAGFSLLICLNLAAVYAVVDTEDQWLYSPMSSSFARVCGLATTLLCLFLFYVGTRWFLTGKYSSPMAAVHWEEPQPKSTLREWGLVALFTLLVGLVSFWGLGDTRAPQTICSGSADLTVKVDGAPSQLMVYRGIQYGGSLSVNDKTIDLNPGDCFSWAVYEIAPADSYHISLNEGEVIELAFRGDDGRLLTVTDPSGSALFDEQSRVPDAPGSENSFIFDEIYHARTGYEMLHGLPIYETTHPPLGKDLIMLGIALFGMNAFGWRFFGTLFGVLLLPVVYALIRRLTANQSIATFGMVLLGLDFMRFTQSRLATIDTYVVFFIALSALFMLQYCDEMVRKGVLGALLPLALSGLAFGLACASKWTGLYAGAGLAVLYFAAFRRRLKNAPNLCDEEFFQAFCAGGAFFVLLPALIYLLSYLPYLNQRGGFNLMAWWECQQNMFRYHSGLNATHPFQSGWYTWPLNLRPVWYYANRNLPAGQAASIAGFFNPVLALGGLVGVLSLAVQGIRKGFSKRSSAVLVLYLAQLLPWLLVTRCTFLYHYWPSAIFGLCALCLALEGLQATARKRIMMGLLLAAAVLFVWFYPVLSGLPVPVGWLDSLKLLPSWGF